MSDSPEIRDSVANMINKRSRTLVEGAERAGARAMLKAVGFTDEDLSKNHSSALQIRGRKSVPVIGIYANWLLM